ncbi:MAG: hypothetical protein ACK5KT_09980 [Dysgonomonas sp.]
MNTGIVERKEYKVDFESGSGSLYIPILGDLFPNLWGQKMNPIAKWILIIDNTEYCVEKDLYDNIKEGDSVEILHTNGLSEIKTI